MNKEYSKTSINLFERLKSDGILNVSGQIVVSFLGLDVVVNDKSPIGNLLQEWLEKYMISRNIYFRVGQNSQLPPDFFLGKSNEADLLEVKTFDYEKSPSFDIANFDAFIRDLQINPFRLNSDYLILGYELREGCIKIKDIWLKKIWEITCPSDVFPIKTQNKQGKIINIRPYNFKTTSSGYQPFSSRLEFVLAIRDTLKKYSMSTVDSEEWFQNVADSYSNFYGSKI